MALLAIFKDRDVKKEIIWNIWSWTMNRVPSQIVNKLTLKCLKARSQPSALNSFVFHNVVVNRLSPEFTFRIQHSAEQYCIIARTIKFKSNHLLEMSKILFNYFAAIRSFVWTVLTRFWRNLEAERRPSVKWPIKQQRDNCLWWLPSSTKIKCFYALLTFCPYF